MEPILVLDGVSVAYGKIEAVREVSLCVPVGSVVTIIGANGAGKTTLLNAIMGLLPSTGRIAFNGRDLSRQEVETRVADGLCLVPERRELFGSMSVHDNLRLGAFRRRGDAVGKAIDEIYGRFPSLMARRDQPASTLSGGERQMLAMGRALMARPRLVMLDEPSLGLAPLIVRDVFQIISELKEAGVAVLLVEQNARAALEVADQGYVLELGRIALQGVAADLANDHRVIESYLGLGGGCP